MNDKHDPNASVPIGTFKASTDDGAFEIPIEIVSDDDIGPETLAIQSNRQPTRGYDEHTPAEVPRRKRVQTLMGVAMPGATLSALPTLPAAHDPTRATKSEISAAIDDVLDEQPTSIYGHNRDSGGLKALESMLEAQMIELPPSSPPGEIVGVVGRETDTGTFEIEVREDGYGEADGRKTLPVLAPKQFVEARARDARDQARPARSRTEPQPVAASTVVSKAAWSETPSRGKPEPQPSAAGAVAANSGHREPREPVVRSLDDARTPPAKPVAAHATAAAKIAAAAPARAKEAERAVAKPSSLAPTEIPRRTGQLQKESSYVGYGLVAAMVLLGIGGWWVTAGGYRRASDVQASQPAAAASVTKPATVPESLALPKSAETNEATAAEPVATAPAEAPAPTPTPAPAIAPERPAKPKVAAKSVRKPVAAPAPVVEGPAETPSREEVRVGLDRVRSSVQACAEGRTGVAEVDVTIAASGRVTNALVGGDFGGTPQGSCIARAVRQAKFSPFKQDRYRVLFPYVL